MIHRRLSKFRWRPRSPRPLIVMYHRIAKLTVDPWGLAVSPDNFSEQITLMRCCRTVLSVKLFIERAQLGTLPRNAVALTFDDGYYDNLMQAGPILAQHEMPATLFLATGPTKDGLRYWWDEVGAMILDAPPLTGLVEIGGITTEVTIGPRETSDDARNGWRAWEPRTARERLHYDLWGRIQSLAPDAIDAALASLRLTFKGQPEAATRAMTVAEIGRLVANTPFILGGHTADHVDLTAHDGRAVLDQILRGKEMIQDLTGCPPVGFAYPYGRNNRTTRLLVEAAGFAWACTTEHGSPSRRPDMFSLPRIVAPDVPHIDWLV